MTTLSGLDQFRASLYEMDYGDQNFDDNNPNYVNQFSERARSFVDTIADKFKVFDINAIKDRVMAINRRKRSHWVSDKIRFLRDLSELQNPPDKMLPYIMAHEHVSYEYENNRCEGYSDRFVNAYKGKTGKDHPLYQQVMNGVGVRDEKAETITFTNYHNVALKKLKKLSVMEQADILSTWRKITEEFNKRNFDPTSSFNNRL